MHKLILTILCLVACLSLNAWQAIMTTGLTYNMLSDFESGTRIGSEFDASNTATLNDPDGKIGAVFGLAYQDKFYNGHFIPELGFRFVNVGWEQDVSGQVVSGNIWSIEPYAKIKTELHWGRTAIQPNLGFSVNATTSSNVKVGSGKVDMIDATHSTSNNILIGVDFLFHTDFILGAEYKLGLQDVYAFDGKISSIILNMGWRFNSF